MLKRQAELQQYLSKKEESIRDHERNNEIEASLEQLLDKSSSAQKNSEDD